MKEVSSTIEAKVRDMFPPQEVEAVLSCLAGMKEPRSDERWATTRARVQAAILISAHSKLDRVLQGVANSQIDWRDTLMAGGLGEGNWPSIAKEAGFDIV